MRFAGIPASAAGFSLSLGPFDVLVAAVAPAFAFLLRDPESVSGAGLQQAALYCIIAFVVTLTSIHYFGAGRILSRFLSAADVVQILKTSLAAAALSAAVGFMISRLDGAPRSIPAIHFVVLAGLLVGGRALKGEWARRLEGRSAFVGAADDLSAGRSENVIIVGATRVADLYAQMLECLPGPQRRVVAVLDADQRLRGRFFSGRIIAGSVDDVAFIVSEYAVHGVRIHRVVVADVTVGRSSAAGGRLIEFGLDKGVHIEFLEDAFAGASSSGSALACAATSPADGLSPAGAGAAQAGSEAGSPRLGYWRARRAVDLIVSLLGLVALAPIMLIVAALVALDVGAPVVFWQERVGRNGRAIRVHKFRTLGSPLDRSGRVLRDDERLSLVGRFLRATRLDEIPQLVDVLRGDMSLIGPRPLLPVDIPSGPSIRATVRPGLTGWAQVHGGKLVTPDEKVALDEYYIRNASFRIDLKIVWRTAVIVVRGDRRKQSVVDRALHARQAVARQVIARQAHGQESRGLEFARLALVPMPGQRASAEPFAEEGRAA